MRHLSKLQSEMFLLARQYSGAVIAASLAVGLMAFQNCSSLKPASPASSTAGVSSSNSLSVLSPNCTFNGQTVNDGQEVIAYLNSSSSASAPCVSEHRVCSQGLLSGSYTYGSCSFNQPKSCLFNGQTVTSGQNVEAFASSTVPAGGTCASETRLCTDGVLSGSAAYGSCQPEAPKACLFNGQTIASGAGVAAYLNSSAAYGSQCVAEARVCNNGTLSGSYAYASCTLSKGDSCLLGGTTVPSGSSLTAFQNGSVPYGSNCVSEERVCANGKIGGSYNYLTCAVAEPSPCLFNGQTIKSGLSVTAYQSSTVPYGQSCVSEQRTCTNGTLSGSDTAASCQPSAPAACSFNGTTVASGQKIAAYTAASVPYGKLCASVAQDYTCTNGNFSPANPTYANCVVNAPAPCVFLGKTLANGETTTNAFSASSVAYGQSCSSIQTTLTCNNGTLSAASSLPASRYTSNSCVTQPGASCSYNGSTLADAHSVSAYSSPTVEIGHSCSEVQVSVSCTNGVLSPANLQTYSTCQPKFAPPCTFDSQSIPSGQTVNAFTAATVPFGGSCDTVAQIYTCNSGSFTPSTPVAASCMVNATPTCQLDGVAVTPKSWTYNCSTYQDWNQGDGKHPVSATAWNVVTCLDTGLWDNGQTAVTSYLNCPGTTPGSQGAGASSSTGGKVSSGSTGGSGGTSSPSSTGGTQSGGNTGGGQPAGSSQPSSPAPSPSPSPSGSGSTGFGGCLGC